MKVHCPKCNSVNFLPSTLPMTKISNISCAVCKALINIPLNLKKNVELNLPDEELMDVSKLRQKLDDNNPFLLSEQHKPHVADNGMPKHNQRLAPTVASTPIIAVFNSLENAPTQEINTAQSLQNTQSKKTDPNVNDEKKIEPGFLTDSYKTNDNSNFLKVFLVGLSSVFLLGFIIWAVWQIVSSRKPKTPSTQTAQTSTQGTQTVNPSTSSHESSNTKQSSGDNTNSSPKSNTNSSTQNQNTANTNANANTQSTDNQNAENAKRERVVKKETTNPNQSPAPMSQSGNITIQVGSYPNSEDANARVAKLQSMGFEARIVRAEIPKRGTWYRVQVGRFSSRGEAEKYAQQLKSKGATKDVLITDVQQ